MKILKIALEAAAEKKAINPVIMDMNGVSGVTDFFLVCSGNSSVQVRAIADNVVDRMIEAKLEPPRKEGYSEGRWVLLDFGSIIVHIMNQEEREFYALESLWHDAKVVQMA